MHKAVVTVTFKLTIPVEDSPDAESIVASLAHLWADEAAGLCVPRIVRIESLEEIKMLDKDIFKPPAGEFWRAVA
jgi:hypothetical protein